jgi:hypothetical protein
MIAFNIFFALLAARALTQYAFGQPMWWFSFTIVVINSLVLLDYNLNS